MDDVTFIWSSAFFLSLPVIVKYMLAFKGRSLYVELRQQERDVDTLAYRLESIERETSAINRAFAHVEIQRRNAQVRCEMRQEQLEQFSATE
jgi:ABC-type phosphate transport system auxiliary subunit